MGAALFAHTPVGQSTQAQSCSQGQRGHRPGHDLTGCGVNGPTVDVGDVRRVDELVDDCLRHAVLGDQLVVALTRGVLQEERVNLAALDGVLALFDARDDRDGHAQLLFDLRKLLCNLVLLLFRHHHGNAFAAAGRHTGARKADDERSKHTDDECERGRREQRAAQRLRGFAVGYQVGRLTTREVAELGDEAGLSFIAGVLTQLIGNLGEFSHRFVTEVVRVEGLPSPAEVRVRGGADVVVIFAVIFVCHQTSSLKISRRLAG